MRAFRPLLLVAVLAGAGAGLAACETYGGPGDYGPWEYGAPARVERGVVIGARPIRFGGGDTGAGAVVGGVSGGLIGSAAAGRHDGFAGGIAGAVLGAIVGSALERSNSQPGFAYLVRFDRDGTEAEIPQADRYPLRQGVRVAVSYGPRVRVTPIGEPPRG